MKNANNIFIFTWAKKATFLFLTLIVFSVNAQQSVKIGVLALRGADDALTKWVSTAEYLNTKIPEYTFKIVPLNFEEGIRAVEKGEVEFILTNSAKYVKLEHLYGVDRIATLKKIYHNQSFNQFGGVIFAKKSRKDIRFLEDLKNKSFAAVHKTSFGGWIMALREFKDLGINPDRDFADIQFVNTHDSVVMAVQSGQLDAGTVRTGILESMDIEGKIDINDFTVLNEQQHETFPLLISTRLYPEWPFARVKHTPDQLSQQVCIALLEMPAENKAAIRAEITGWTVPRHYQLVTDCLKELRIDPYKDLGKITLGDLFQQYMIWILIFFIGLIIIGVILFYIAKLNRKLRGRTIELKKTRAILEQTVEERTVELSEKNKKLEHEILEHKKAEKELAKYRNHLEDLVNERTQELEDKNNALSRINKLFVGRELRMKELKEEIENLKGSSTDSM